MSPPTFSFPVPSPPTQPPRNQNSGYAQPPPGNMGGLPYTMSTTRQLQLQPQTQQQMGTGQQSFYPTAPSYQTIGNFALANPLAYPSTGNTANAANTNRYPANPANPVANPNSYPSASFPVSQALAPQDSEDSDDDDYFDDEGYKPENMTGNQSRGQAPRESRHPSGSGSGSSRPQESRKKSSSSRSKGKTSGMGGWFGK